MTTAKTPKSPPPFQLPDPPKTPDEKMTAAQHLSITGSAHFLAQHLGNPQATIVGSDRYITLAPTAQRDDMTGVVYPDLLVAFNVDPASYLAHNGYVISEQGKPPDFVLEVASASTGRRDAVDKRVIYAELGIAEYWRFDENGPIPQLPAGRRPAGGRRIRTHSRSPRCRTATSEGAASSSVWNSAGPTVIWAGMTLKPATTSPPLTPSAKPALQSARADSKPKQGCEIFKRNCTN